SFKQHEKIEGLDLSSIIDIDTEASIEGFKDGIIVSDTMLSVSRVNVQSVSEKIENVDAKIFHCLFQSGITLLSTPTYIINIMLIYSRKFVNRWGIFFPEIG